MFCSAGVDRCRAVDRRLLVGVSLTERGELASHPVSRAIRLAIGAGTSACSRSRSAVMVMLHLLQLIGLACFTSLLTAEE